MNKERKAQIEEWKAKGAEWCAAQLYSAREQLSKEKERRRSEHEKSMKNIFDSHFRYPLEKANECMATVLQENGIRPVRLRLTYKYSDCDSCHESYGEEAPCAYGYCNQTETVTESVGLYTCFIDGSGTLEGITSQFETEKFDLLKAVDERTGEVIYEFTPDKKS